MVQISFVIPVLNDARRLARCLESIDRNKDGHSIETIVVDNGSNDDSVRVGRDAGADVLSAPGVSVAELRNIGAAAAHGRILAFVDADQELLPGWIQAAVDQQRDPRVGMAGAPYLAPLQGTWVQRAYARLRGRVSGAREARWLEGGNVVMARTVFDHVGGFDAGLNTCEDVDLCRRVRAAGLRIVSDQRLGSTHAGDPATLGAVFRGELWRGRDNLRVSLRRPLSKRDVITALVPVIDLLCAAVALASLVAWGLPAWRVALALAAVMPLLSIVRTGRVLHGNAFTTLEALQTLVVAVTYDAARACALVVRAKHHRSISRP